MKKPAAVSRDGFQILLHDEVLSGTRQNQEFAGFRTYLALSAEFVSASPPFEISWPAPAIVLQPASMAVPAMRSKAISRVMKVLLVEDASVDVSVFYGTR